MKKPNKLKLLGPDDRHLFRARVGKFTERPRWKRFERAVVLENVKLWPGGERVANRQVFFLGREFERAGGLWPGDWIEFEARAARATTGYRGPDPRLRRAYPVQVKWTLSRPSKVRKVDPAPTGPADLATPHAGPGPAAGRTPTPITADQLHRTDNN